MLNETLGAVSTTVGIVSTIITGVSTIVATIQTMRLRTAKKIIDTQVRAILLESRDLASHLFNEAHGNVHMLQCGEKAQHIQKALWLMVINMSNISEKEVERKWQQKLIGDYEYRLLKDLTKKI